jgi:PAS domain S-box-containing protein
MPRRTPSKRSPVEHAASPRNAPAGNTPDGKASAASPALRGDEHFRRLTAAAFEGIGLSENGMIVDVNDQLASMLGYKPAELIGRPVTDLVAPEDIERVMQSMRSGGEQPYVHLSRRKDGSVFPVEVRAKYLNLEGRGLRVTAVVDITERERVAAALRESEERLRVSLDAGRMTAWTLDAVTGRASWSGPFEKLHGFPADEFGGTDEHYFQLVHPEEREEVARLVRGARAGTLDRIFTEHRVVWPNGSIHWLAGRGEAIRDTDGVVRQVAGTLVDVTERMELLAHLRASQERLALVLEGAGVGLWDHDEALGRTYVSDRYRELFGFGPDESFEADEYFRRNVHPEDRSRTDEVLAEMSSTRRPVAWEVRVRDREGQLRWFRYTAQGQWDTEGVLVRRAGSVEDITARKDSELALAAHNLALVMLSSSPDVHGGELDAAFREITMQGARALGVERCGVWLFDSFGERIDCRALYRASIDSFESGDSLWAEDHPTYFASLEEGRALAVDDASDDARTSELAESYLEPLGITSLLDAPVMVRGKLAGLVCLEHVGPHRDWTAEDSSFAASLADFVARALEVGERRRVEERLHGTYQQLRALARRLEAAEANERKRISREMHDEIGQSLTAIKISLSLVSRDPSSAASAGRVEDAIRLVDTIIQHVRELALELRPALLDEVGLVAALRGHLEEQAERAGLELQFDSPAEESRLPPEMEIACFRVVQETLTNVIRHAGAKVVTVKLDVTAERVRIEVRDDGCGFNPEAALSGVAGRRRLGLAGMRERMDLLGGELEIVSAPGKGTTVTATLPLGDAS